MIPKDSRMKTKVLKNDKHLCDIIQYILFMSKIQNEIINWFENRSISIDAIHGFIKLKLTDSYEIGDAGLIINNMITEGLLITNDL